MDSESRQGPLTSGTSNPELGTKALARLIREVVEEVLETKVKEISETFQARCLECKKKRDHSSLRTEPHSVKHVKTRPNFLAYEHCNGCYPGEWRRKTEACPDTGLRSIGFRIAQSLLS
ncbi:hypothetical protein J1N35_043795 [Gossypium stocksii]|uniref:Uncharacterized protein n=1 Tax=Gossypium stocksii TaxID=47602 RepID=A0A9D3U8A3_9ROSI|nr:hypothetical protein J1N35_043795 [Gossypium stocksii]